MSRLTYIAAVAATLLAATALPAAAHVGEDYVETRTMRVSFADLDLNAASDADRLLDRISRAARNSCRNTAGRTLEERALDRACAAEAEDQAVAALDHPRVNAQYAARTGRTPAEIHVAQAPE